MVKIQVVNLRVALVEMHVVVNKYNRQKVCGFFAFEDNVEIGQLFVCE